MWFKEKRSKTEKVQCYIYAFEPDENITAFELAKVMMSLTNIQAISADGEIFVPVDQLEAKKAHLGDAWRMFECVDIREFNAAQMAALL